MENKNCPFCKKDNLCQALKEKCWCFSIKVPKEILLYSPKDNKSCICKNCIEEFKKDKKSFLVKYNLL